jgi:predicted dehydrogenase
MGVAKTIMNAFRTRDSQMDKEPINLAIIGCGKVTEQFYLPAISQSKSYKVSALVDVAESRTQMMSHCFGSAIQLKDYRDLDDVDAAVVALPHHLHAPVSIELLEKGIHVLVEKPMAMNFMDCQSMIDAARLSDAILAVGMLRRHYAAMQFVHQIIQQQLLGSIQKFDLREGYIFNWKATTDFLFRKRNGGGLLIDIGSHVLDLLLWWFGDCRYVEYYDDAMGGVEAEVEMHLEFHNGTKGFVELSRTRNLRNSLILYGERGILEVGTSHNPPVQFKLNETDIMLNGQVHRNYKMDVNNKVVFGHQMESFARAINGIQPPAVSGEEGSRVVELIERCYKSRKLLKQSWVFI